MKQNSLLKVITATFLCLVILLVVVVLAIKISNFNGENSPINLTFTGNQNQTLNITIYRYANVTSAFMNLSGYGYVDNVLDLIPDSTDYAQLVTGYYYVTRTAMKKFVCGNVTSLGRWIAKQGAPDGNITFTIRKVSDDTIILSKDMGAVSSLSTSKSYLQANFSSFFICEDVWLSVELPMQVSSNGIYYYENTNYRIRDTNGTLIPNSNYTIYHNYVYNSSLGWNDTIGDNSIFLPMYNITYIHNGFPTNPLISVNQTHIWNYTGIFNQTNNKTSDFSQTLNKSLNKGNCDCAGCLIDGKNCVINFTFHSDTAGILEVSDLNINWQESNFPNLTIQHPNQTYSGITYVPLNFTAIDDWQLETCYFNVTRGASLEVANTIISNCLNTTFLVSGSANYVLHMCINDTSGNQNCTESSFSTTDYVPYVPPPPSAGGGGGYVPPEINVTKAEKPCSKTYPLFLESYDNFKSEMSWDKFKLMWFAFWNSSFCQSGASIIPRSDLY